jgi:hypothetical protein
MKLGGVGLNTGAGVAATPVIHATGEPDPIFSILDAHLQAWGRFTEIDDSDQEAFEEAGRAADAAMVTLMSTPPTTLAGMRTIIQYLVDWDNSSGYHYLPTLLRSPIFTV